MFFHFLKFFGMSTKKLIKTEPKPKKTEKPKTEKPKPNGLYIKKTDYFGFGFT